ncbi:glucan 1,3-beta-glucosidase [Ascoidea rubescens DSM 1968]|uniref:glucan endo-1,3-beta-D-glucosidase n=1 Tax=Ascoidea rubescens DSM 1968 TaxID=1344418 RepID=A0A1D2VS81_9ASCO|nr:glycoside hydrolase family 17 protein [Ascoidea rubescens DSM 1968]ODV64448.1 glycoside hydrolase family 17 protein [Ascoidea rubescens DSM 1968]
MTLAMGIWIGDDDQINNQQILHMKKILSEYDQKYFDAIYVGNEVLFRNEKTSSQLAQYINQVKSYISQMNYDIKVGTTEINSKIDPIIVEASDVVGANIHPFFGGDHVKQATSWVLNAFEHQIKPINNLVDNPAQLVLSEVGWPSGGGSFLNSVAGYNEMQIFLDTFVCEAKKIDTPWYFFEAFDEPWKEIYYTDDSQWETEWGIFTDDRKLKPGIVLPTCQ